ncbi:MAG: HEAT repeat domain-containing protein [Methanofollis sp.]|uniref:HEAT repeat domain-containing protein n=1 Tax=Methanofollis sp. TaxID=2052835 RepID=UPI002624114E|nr:HEAT repeat domain-containing protein [Methanofollis sp.]MDD4255028.1 HEAT repeat domain-containing protein [Methanofollis sp.]
MEHEYTVDDAEEGLRLALSGAEEARIRGMAAILIGKTGDDPAALVLALGDADKGVRARAMEGLVAQGAVLPLVRALQNPAWRVRYRAAEGLGRIGDRRAVGPLVRALRDEKDHVRYMTAKALGLIADPAARDALLPLLSDPNPPARKAAAFALGRVGGADEALEAALVAEPSGAVRRAIRDALGRP